MHRVEPGGGADVAVSLPVVPCHRCGVFFQALAMDHEDAIVPTEGPHVVIAVARIFRAECPKDGPFIFQATEGHHSTGVEAEMKRRFGRQRTKIKAQLEPEERKATATLEGKRWPMASDIARWEAMARSRP